jgi:hypothetical protein
MEGVAAIVVVDYPTVPSQRYAPQFLVSIHPCTIAALTNDQTPRESDVNYWMLLQHQYYPATVTTGRVEGPSACVIKQLPWMIRGSSRTVKHCAPVMRLLRMSILLPHPPILISS